MNKIRYCLSVIYAIIVGIAIYYLFVLFSFVVVPLENWLWVLLAVIAVPIINMILSVLFNLFLLIGRGSRSAAIIILLFSCRAIFVPWRIDIEYSGITYFWAAILSVFYMYVLSNRVLGLYLCGGLYSHLKDVIEDDKTISNQESATSSEYEKIMNKKY